ncbi:MAG: DUF853 family protein [Erysipelotrichaceae bacterium]|nr:DUF853 family protein [Erysipelotrichaceae bacterium]
MLKDNLILMGKAGDKEIFAYPNMLNRHGLIAGATGTGKTVTLKVLAESLSDLGVPTFIADIKSDITGMLDAGNIEGIQERLDSMGIEGFTCTNYPTQFFDVLGEKGHPVRATAESIGPELLGRMLEVTDVQMGVLTIMYRLAKDMGLALLDLKDLKAMANYVGEHASEITTTYGNVSKQSAGAIIRALLRLEEQGGDKFIGEPEIDIYDWFKTEDGKGMMNILECSNLINRPILYSSFMLWLLTELYENLPEVGDLPKPKMVFFFEEAHFLFDSAPKSLLDKIEQTVKLIRSKGVGVFFITQSPADIPAGVLAQCSNRIQHALRAYTPSEIKAVKLAAQSFRENPDLDTSEEILNLKTGYALISMLDGEGTPTMVEKVKVCPPRSSMNAADDTKIMIDIKSDMIYGKYEKEIDNDSAYEGLEREKVREEQEKLAAEEAARLEKERIEAEKKAEKERIAEEKAIEKEKERKAKKQQQEIDRLKRKVINKVENKALKAAEGLILGLFKK